MASRETTLKLIKTATKARDLLQKKLDQSRSSRRPPAARGDDFAEGFTSGGRDSGLSVSSRTGASIGSTLNFGSSGGGLSEADLASAAQRNLSKIRESISGTSRTGDITGKSSADLLRTSNVGSTLGESVTAEGRRSSRVLSDKEVDEYGARGFFEGDFVPGEGTLLPDGSFDRSQIDLMEKLQAEAERLQAQADGLEKQDKTSAGEATSSDTEIVQQEEAAVDYLNREESAITTALDLLSEQESILKEQLDSEIDAIKASYDSERNSTADAQAREVGSTSVGLAQSGGYLGFSGSGTGVMLSLTKSHRAEMTNLKLKRDQLISEAKQASAERRFDAVRETAREIARIEEEAYERQEKYNEETKKVADKQKEEAERQQTQTDIFNAIQAGNKSAKDIFSALDGKVDIEEISDFLKSVGSTNTDGFKLSSSNKASLLGAGMSSDDIAAFNEYVNENGYDETVRSAMTPAERAAADKIFREVKKTTGKDDPNDKVMSILDLNRIEENYGVKFPPGLTAGTINEFIQDNWGESEEEMQATIDSLWGPQGDGESDTGGFSIEYNEDWMRENLSDSQLKTIADLVGASSWWFSDDTEDVNSLFSNESFLNSFKERVEEIKRQFGISSDEEVLNILTSG